MRKRISVVVLGICLIGIMLLDGCQSSQNPFTPANEIVTYEEIDDSKTQIMISRTGNIYLNKIIQGFEAEYPDIQVIELDITGGTGNVCPLADWIEHGQAPDIVINSVTSLTEEGYENYFENLSDRSYLSSFSSEALNTLAVGANIYLLPGPSSIDCISYNKTLFERYGWQVPQTFDEFVALCDRITSDTNGEIQSWNPNAKYTNNLNICLEAFCYGELFSGAKNRQWYEDYLSGEESYSEHMRPFYDYVQIMIDHNLIKEEHFSYSATTRGEEFQDGKIAMINHTAKRYKSDEYEFAFMPYPGKEAGNGYVNITTLYGIGVSKKERKEKEAEAVEQFMKYYSSTEGQKKYIGDELMYSSVQGVELEDATALGGVTEALDAGRMFEQLDFQHDGWKGSVDLYRDVQKMVSGEQSAEECMQYVEEHPYVCDTDQVSETKDDVVATAKEEFTILETSEFMADMYREKAGSDIALINNLAAYRGNLMKIFAGDLTATNITVLKPRSLANNSKLICVSMTGQQLLDALNHPFTGSDTVSNSIYAYSGLKCEVAPMNAPGSKYLKVWLEDGSDVVADQIYSVAIWEGTVADEYITSVDQTFEGTWEELMTERLVKNPEIAPAKDKRIKLVWNQK